MLWRSAVAINTYLLLKRPIDGFFDRIAYIYELEEHQLLVNPVDICYSNAMSTGLLRQIYQ